MPSVDWDLFDESVVPALPEAEVFADSLIPKNTPSSSDIWGEWLNTWNESQDALPSSEGRSPDWWELPEEYPESVNSKASKAASPDLSFGAGWHLQPDEYTQPVVAKTVSEEDAFKFDSGTVWENTWDWVKKKAAEVADIAASIVEPIEQKPAQAVPAITNYLWGNPFGEDGRGEAWKAVAYGGFQAGTDALRRAIGWASDVTTGTKLNEITASGLQDPFVYSALMQGTYAEMVRQQSFALSSADREINYQEALAYQESFTAKYNQYLKQGLSTTAAQKKAAADIAVEKVREQKVQPVLGGESTSENPLGLSSFAQEAWAESEGYRYSHTIRPDLAREYERLRDSGVSPADAGEQTTDPAMEIAMQLVLDPNWIMPIDNLIIEGAWGATKGLAGGLIEVGASLPGIRGGVQWAGELTARTTANYAARHTDDALRWFRRYADEQALELTPSLTARLLASPPEDLLTSAPAYYRRAIAGMQPYADEIVKGLEKSLALDALEEAMEKASLELLGSADEVTEGVLLEKAKEILWHEAVTDASRRAYSASLDAYVSKHPMIAKVIEKAKPLNQVLTGAKGVMVDTWLGLRPSWNVFNYVDNMVKLVLDGVNPFNSLPDLASRYSLYSPEIVDVASATEDLGKIKFWNLSPSSNSAYQEILRKMTPKQALGTFGEAVLTSQSDSLLQKLPITKQVINWNTTLSGRIEMSMRARAYFKHFFDTLDNGWTAMVQRTPSAILNGQNVELSSELAEVLAGKLSTLQNPTAESVKKLFSSILTTEQLEVVVPKLGADLGENFASLPPTVTKSVQRQLNHMVELGSHGPTGVTRQAVNRVFDEAAAQVMRTYDNMVSSGIKALDDTLPVFPKTTDDLYRTLVRSGEEAGIDELFQAFDDMPLVAKRANLESTRMSAEHWAKITELRKARTPAAVVSAVQDKFLLDTRPAFWNEFNRIQAEAAEKIMNQVDETMAAAGKTERFPRHLAERYLQAGQAITAVEHDKYKIWRVAMQQLNKPHLAQETREEIFRLSRTETDKLWQEVYPSAKAAIHDSLVGIREWFVHNGLELDNPQALKNLSKNVDWGRVGEQVDNIPVAARKTVKPMLDELARWKDEVIKRRTVPYEEVSMSVTDRRVLLAYGERMANETGALISTAVDGAVDNVNKVLFDYETTQNWMSALGNIVPFVRFPAKNIPFWIEKCTEVPHLAGSVARVRELQAAFNADLPSRLKYSVKLPSSLTDPLMEALGFHNVELRINPWSFISAFQQIPGATSFSMRKLEELSLDDGDIELKKRFRAFSTISEQFGFGMWPYLEWALGMQGLFGSDWYPGDVLGTWTPTVNWALREVFGYDHSFDIDEHMRRTLPTWWNYLFGKTPLDWTQLNPKLLEEWSQGREVEGVLMSLPDPAVAALSTITPVQAKELVKGMDPVTIEAIRERVAPIFTMTSERQSDLITKFTPEEQAVFLDEMEKIGLRLAVRKRAFTSLMGNMFGLYTEPVNAAELEAKRLRTNRRLEQSHLEPGQERRDYMRQWYEEHPKYQMVQTWRFSEHPWAETAAGREAEVWDGIVDGYKSRYFDFNDMWNTLKDKQIAETYRAHPGDVLRLKKVKADMYAQRDAYVAMLNEELGATLTAKMEAYIEEYPRDFAGIDKLRNGWETNLYIPIELNEEELAELALFDQVNPDDAVGYKALYTRLYEQARKRQPPTQTKHVAGLNEGIKMNLEWSPVNNANYTEEEVQQYLIGNLLDRLQDAAPDKDDYETTNEWWDAYNAYIETLPQLALESKQGQDQVSRLMEEQKYTQAQAEELVLSWYSADELQAMWRQGHSPWEALESVYQWRFISEADDHWFEEILPIKDEDYDLYALSREDLDLRFGALPAKDFIKYILQDYPDRWTQAELEKLFDGVTMPSYFNRMTLRAKGEKAVDSHIWHFYNQLDADKKLEVREKFGPIFQDQFLSGNASDISIELRGSWLNALAESFGDTTRWLTLPGVDEEILQSSSKEKREFGLAFVGPKDEVEFEKARKVNHEYWLAKVSGNATLAEQLEKDELRQKWFGLSSAQSYFWDMYYSQIPPGPFAKELRDNPMLKLVLDTEVRQVAATVSDYDRATRFIEKWLVENDKLMADAGLNPAEYDQVRALTKAYYAIPEENKDVRKKFLADNPLLLKYWNAGKESTPTKAASTGKLGTAVQWKQRGGGGGGSSGSGGESGSSESTETKVKVDSAGLWAAFKTRVGQSLPTVLRMLTYYWMNGTLPEKAQAYLTKLHGELGGELTFEEWLEALQAGWGTQGTNRSYGRISIPSVPKVPEPRYYNSTSGFRR